MSKFGSILRSGRLSRGFTQRRLAAAVGVDFSYVSKLENGSVEAPAVAVVERFAETLGLPCEDFLAAAKKLPTEAVASLSGQVGALRFLRKAAESVLTEHEWERMIRELHELRAGVVAPSDRQHTTSPHKHSQRLHYPNLRGKQVFLAVRDTDMYESLLTIFVQLRASVARYYEVNACLDSLRQKACDILVIESDLADADSPQSTMVQVFRAVPWVPVIVISTLGDLQGAKEAFKSGAVDFLTKPIDQELLVAAIAKAYEFEVRLDYLPGRQLTPAEKRVLLLLLSGNSNKEIAHVLSRSVRTVEVHRRRVMRKFGAANIVDVVKGAIRHGLIDV